MDLMILKKRLSTFLTDNGSPVICFFPSQFTRIPPSDFQERLTKAIKPSGHFPCREKQRPDLSNCFDRGHLFGSNIFCDFNTLMNRAIDRANLVMTVICFTALKIDWTWEKPEGLRSGWCAFAFDLRPLTPMLDHLNPPLHIANWRRKAPWGPDAQIEQDLVLTKKAVIQIYSNPHLAEAFEPLGATTKIKTRPKTPVNI